MRAIDKEQKDLPVDVVDAHFGGCLVKGPKLGDGNDEFIGGEAARWLKCLCGNEQCVAEGSQVEDEMEGDWKEFYMIEMGLAMECGRLMEYWNSLRYVQSNW